MKFSSLLFVAVSILITAKQSLTSAEYATHGDEKRILDNLLDPKNYDHRIRPKSGMNQTGDAINAPVIVTVNIFVRRIDYISSDKMQFKAQLTFRQEWNDSRLVYDSMNGKIKYLSIQDASLIWTPDVFFPNSISGQHLGLLSPNVLIRIFPDGKILYSTRISMELSCPMDLRYFPADAQTCTMKIAPYGYTTEDLILKWSGPGKDPVHVSQALNIPDFTLTNYHTDYCSSKTNTGEYSCIIASFEFRREFSRFLVRVYIPCVMLLIISYLALWIKSQELRIIVSLLSLLSLAAGVSSVTDDFPKVSYTMAVDVWTGCCLTLAMISLLIVIVMSYLPEDSSGREQTCEEEGADKPMLKHGHRVKRMFGQRMTRCRVESFVRILYPVVFVVFVFTYWICN